MNELKTIVERWKIMSNGQRWASIVVVSILISLAGAIACVAVYFDGQRKNEKVPTYGQSHISEYQFD